MIAFFVNWLMETYQPIQYMKMIVVKVIFDASPAAPGHILILPKNHYDDIYSMDDETAAHVFKVAVKLSKAYRKALDFDGLNIVQNNGEAAGQTVFHFHMHIIPRYKNDTVNVDVEAE